MSGELILPLFMRWMHIISAIVGVGGTVFLALVLIPAIKKYLPEDAAPEFRTRVMKRWKLVFHPLIVLFLVSGFYNYIAVTSASHQGQSLYHALFGAKFLLAIVFFGSVIVATSTMKWSEKFRAKNGIWAFQILVALAIILVAGVMKTLPISTEEIPDSAPVETVEE